MTISSLFKLKHLLPILLLVFFVQGCNAGMFGFFKSFKKETVEVFPAVSGQLTLEGKPLQNVRIRRAYEYIDIMDEEKADYTTTDAEGRFHFPALTMRTSHPNKLFTVTIVWQGIQIDDPNYPKYSDVFLWHAHSTGIKHNPYYVEMLNTLNCDLSNEVKMLNIVNPKYPEGSISYTIDSICRWPEQAKIEEQKQSDLEQYGELKSAEFYGDIIDLR